MNRTLRLLILVSVIILAGLAFTKEASTYPSQDCRYPLFNLSVCGWTTISFGNTQYNGNGISYATQVISYISGSNQGWQLCGNSWTRDWLNSRYINYAQQLVVSGNGYINLGCTLGHYYQVTSEHYFSGGYWSQYFLTQQ